MANGHKGIAELLAKSDDAIRAAKAAREELDKKLSNCGKNIKGIECSFITDGRAMDIRLNAGERGIFTTDAETFSKICGWFGKHYIGGTIDEDGQPSEKKES